MTGSNPSTSRRGLIDTSVVIALGQLPPGAFPEEPAIAAVTLAELAAGPHATDDPDERARRQDRLQRIEVLMEPLPFDAAAAPPTVGSMRLRGRAIASLEVGAPRIC